MIFRTPLENEMKTKKEYREWTLLFDNGMEVVTAVCPKADYEVGKNIEQCDVIEASAVSAVLEELKLVMGQFRVELNCEHEWEPSESRQCERCGLASDLAQSLTRANNFLKQWEDGDENT